MKAHWTHRQPRRASKWTLAVILVPFLFAGCSEPEKARTWLGVAAETCKTIHKIKDRCNDREKFTGSDRRAD